MRFLIVVLGVCLCVAGGLQKANADHCPSSDTKTEIINGRAVTHGCKLDEGEAVLVYLGIVAGVIAVLGRIAWAVSSSSKSKEREGLKEIEEASLIPAKNTSFMSLIHHRQNVPNWLVIKNVGEEDNFSAGIGIDLFAIMSRE